MLGVRRLILFREGAWIRGEEDFFSVARTMPFVAVRRDGEIETEDSGHGNWHTFDS